MHNTTENDPPKFGKQRLLDAAAVISILAISAYSCVAHLSVTEDRVNLLHNLATSRDARKIRIELGRLYVDAGDYDKAIHYYRQAKPAHWNKGNDDGLFQAWLTLDEQAPFNPRVHLGFGEFFESMDLPQQAEMEYEQARTIVPRDKEVAERLANLEKAGSNHDVLGQTTAFERNLASKWHPPVHTGCLVTRCLIFTDKNGFDGLALIGKSGSDAHDQSAVNTITSSPVHEFAIFRQAGIHHIACMSNGDKKTVTIASECEVNVVESTPAEQLNWRLQGILHSIHRQTGVLSL